MQTIHSVTRQQLPLIFCMREQREVDNNTEEDDKGKREYAVSFDFFQAGQLAAEHLLSLGHRRVALLPHLAADGKPETNYARAIGFLTTMGAHGHPVDSELIVAGDGTPEGGQHAAASLLTRPESPSAIFATNDLTADRRCYLSKQIMSISIIIPPTATTTRAPIHPAPPLVATRTISSFPLTS